MTLTDLQPTYFKAQLANEQTQWLNSEPDTLHSDIDRVDIKGEIRHADAVEREIALGSHGDGKSGRC